MSLIRRCDRTWAELEGQGSRRHCARCDETVHDLDAMDEDSRAALLGSAAPACVRWVAAALVATALSGPAHAQETRPGEGPLPEVAETQEVMGALDKERIRGPLTRNPQLVDAYEARLKKKPKLAGRMTVKFTLEGGKVTDAIVQSSTLADPELEQAVLEIVRGLTFEVRERAIVSYPFAFAPPEP